MDEPLYRRLQQHLDRMPVGFPATDSGIELRILQRLFTVEEAEAALGLSMMPETAPVIARRLGKDWSVERLRTVLGIMARKGVIERLRLRGSDRYAKSILAVGIYERQLTRLTPELQRDVDAYFEEAFAAAFHAGRTPQMRTVPIQADLTPSRAVAKYDDIRAWVRLSEGPFAVMDCICRKGRELTGQRCRQELRQSCLTFGAAARGMVASGAARTIAREEVLQILDMADAEGLVLQPQNTQDPWFVCCCCGCCCGVLRSAKMLPRPADHFSTGYRAVVDEEVCGGCESCIPRCQMEAVAMNQGVAAIDLARCIGCGLCVTTCTTGAMQLHLADRPTEPPKSVPGLYVSIYRERFGTWETAKALGKAVLRRRI